MDRLRSVHRWRPLHLIYFAFILSTTRRWQAMCGVIPKTMAAAGGTKESTTTSSTVRRHPRAPPPPMMHEPSSLNSTLVKLQLEQGEWIVQVGKDTPYNEMRALLDGIVDEAAESDPMNAAAMAGQWEAQRSARRASYAAQRGHERTVFWFEHGGSRDVFETYLSQMEATATSNPIRILEIGTFEGASAMWFAEHLLLHPDSSLICIDTWAGSEEFSRIDVHMASVEERFKLNMAKTPNSERVYAFKLTSFLALSRLIADGATATFDVVYVDGAHRMANTLSDGLLSFRLLKVGGLQIFDDIKTFTDVDRGTTVFVEALGEKERRLEVLHRESQMVIRKIAEDPGVTPSIVGGTKLRWT